MGVSTLVLALDTCSRALLYIYEKSARGAPSEYNAAMMMRNNLMDYAEQLHQICKIDLVSLRRSATRSVKKRLKQLKQAFRDLGSVASYQQNYAHAYTRGDTTGPLAIFQGEHHQAPSGMPPIPPSADKLSDTVDCSQSFGFRPFGSVEDPCSFVSEPGLGSLLGFPAFTKIDDATFRRTGQLDGAFDVQQHPSTPTGSDALQYSMSTYQAYEVIARHDGDVPDTPFHVTSEPAATVPPDFGNTVPSDWDTIGIPSFYAVPSP